MRKASCGTFSNYIHPSDAYLIAPVALCLWNWDASLSQGKWFNRSDTDTTSLWWRVMMRIVCTARRENEGKKKERENARKQSRRCKNEDIEPLRQKMWLKLSCGSWPHTRYSVRLSLRASGGRLHTALPSPLICHWYLRCLASPALKWL